MSECDVLLLIYIIYKFVHNYIAAINILDNNVIEYVTENSITNDKSPTNI